MPIELIDKVVPKNDGFTGMVDADQVIAEGTFLDGCVSESNVTQHESAINHNNLTNYVGSEHIDWTTDQGATNIHSGNYIDTNTTYTAGTGMTLNGTTFDCDITQYTDADAVTAIKADVDWNATNWDTAYGWGDHSSAGYLTAEVNDLTASVTWANVPDANITQSSVTQHESALSITESQISDLDHYTSTDFDTDFATKDTDDLTEGDTNKYDQDVTLTEGSNITITGTYPDFTIAADSGGSPYVSNEGLVLEMNFNSESVDTTNNYAYDASVTKGHGTISGATHHSTGGFNDGGYFEFDGSNDYIDCTDIEMSSYTNLTVSLWFRTSSVTSNSRLIGKDQAGTPGNFLMINQNGDTWIFQAYDDTAGGWAKAEYASQTEEDGEWHHIVGVVDTTNSKVYLYMDGEEQDNTAFTDSNLSDGDNEIITIGADSDTAGAKAQLWDGDIDEVKIYSRALSATEISNLYNSKQECRDINPHDKLQIYSISPPQFIPYEPNTDDVTIQAQDLTSNENSNFIYAHINLPQGAVMKEIKVWGSNTSNTWICFRGNLDDGTTYTNIASANMDSADTSISNSRIDNENYYYIISVPLNNADELHGARITYTP